MAQASHTPLAISRPKITRCATVPLAAFMATNVLAKATAATHNAEDLTKMQGANAIGQNAKDTSKNIQPSSSAENAGGQDGHKNGAFLSPFCPHRHHRHRRQHQLTKNVASCHHQVWVRDQIQHQLASPGTSTWRPNPAPAAASLAKDLCSAPLPMLSSVSPWSRLQFPLTMWSTPRFTSRPTKS